MALIQTGEFVHFFLAHGHRGGRLLHCIEPLFGILEQSLGVLDIFLAGTATLQSLKVSLDTFVSSLPVIELVHDADGTLGLKVSLGQISSKLLSNAVFKALLSFIHTAHTQRRFDSYELASFRAELKTTHEHHLNTDIS